MRIHLRHPGAIVAALLLCVGASASADEAPISGTVKNVDAAAGTMLIESASKGKVREVVIHVRPDSKVVRFVRSTDATKPGFSERPALLADVKPGWTVSVKTKHEGQKEIAEVVNVVHEK
jgi:hypothetical protein